MQTFLPLPDMVASLSILDNKRLNKQRSEARGILNSIYSENGWWNHPAVQMWVGYEDALVVYGNLAISIWASRGYENNMPMETVKGKIELPPWFGDDRFHSSHRSNLLRKVPVYYGKFGWTEPPDLPYFWPTKEGYAQKET